MQNDYQSPFDDNGHHYFVLSNDRQQQSLWPVFAPIPAGWCAEFGPAAREQCIDYVNIPVHGSNRF